jgi:hypothetical protein
MLANEKLAPREHARSTHRYCSRAREFSHPSIQEKTTMTSFKTILALGAVYWLVRDQGQPREIIAAGDG